METFLKVAEVAEIMQVSERQVLNMCKSEKTPIPHIRVNGRAIRFRRADLDKWFEKNTIAAL
jgi:excisionase family DNA binding protein